jgi:hypothetical protein
MNEAPEPAGSVVLDLHIPPSTRDDIRERLTEIVGPLTFPSLSVRERIREVLHAERVIVPVFAQSQHTIGFSIPSYDYHALTARLISDYRRDPLGGSNPQVVSVDGQGSWTIYQTFQSAPDEEGRQMYSLYAERGA